MSEKTFDERGREQVPAWYGIAITTNKENIVRNRIKALAETDMWKDQIFDAILPSYTDVNAKGKKVEKLHYTQIGYVHMILNSETWNALEMLRGIGFRAILPAGDAQPIPQHEMQSIFKMIGREDDVEELSADWAVGEDVMIADAEQPALFGQTGTILELYRTEALISLELLGKETKLRIGFGQIEKKK